MPDPGVYVDGRTALSGLAGALWIEPGGLPCPTSNSPDSRRRDVFATRAPRCLDPFPGSIRNESPTQEGWKKNVTGVFGGNRGIWVQLPGPACHGKAARSQRPVEADAKKCPQTAENGRKPPAGKGPPNRRKRREEVTVLESAAFSESSQIFTRPEGYERKF